MPFDEQREAQVILARLHRELTNVVAAPDVVERLAADGSRPQIERPEEFAAFLREDIARWEKVVTASDMKHN